LTGTQRTIQVPFTEAKLITGRCTLHDCDLKLVSYADDGLDTIMDAWHCPGLYKDPDLLALNAEERALSKKHPLAMDFWPQDAVDERQRHWARGKELRDRCVNSWVLVIPVGRPEGRQGYRDILSSISTGEGFTIPVIEDGAITCPRCSRTSHNPDDVREGYCGNCHDWTWVDRGTPEIT